MDVPAVPGDWVARMADTIAAAVREFAPIVGDDRITLFAVDCHPWHGMLGLAVLTADEAATDPELNDPAEMAAWRHYDFASGLAAGRALIPLGAEMRSAYYEAGDRPATAEAYLRACVSAAASPTVAAALDQFKRADGFRLSVTHPDSGREFVA